MGKQKSTKKKTTTKQQKNAGVRDGRFLSR
jgi:hypothetical protein